MLALFDLTPTIKQYTTLSKTVKDNLAAFNTGLLQWIDDAENTLTTLQTVADKFQLQLNKLFNTDGLPGENDVVQQRLSSAANYFIQQIDGLIAMLSQSPASTDSKLHAKAYNEALKEVFVLLTEKKHLMQSCIEKFSVNNYYSYKKSFIAPALYVNAYATAASEQKTETPHPLLHKKLRDLRNKICD